MTEGKMFRWKMTGAAILGLALCVPAAMLAQNGAAPPPPPDNSGMGAQQGAPLRFNCPADAAVRQCGAQCRHRGQCVKHIAHRAETYDENS